jgi:hypothetical protein
MSSGCDGKTPRKTKKQTRSDCYRTKSVRTSWDPLTGRRVRRGTSKTNRSKSNRSRVSTQTTSFSNRNSGRKTSAKVSRSGGKKRTKRSSLKKATQFSSTMGNSLNLYDLLFSTRQYEFLCKRHIAKTLKWLAFVCRTSLNSGKRGFQYNSIAEDSRGSFEERTKLSVSALDNVVSSLENELLDLNR